MNCYEKTRARDDAGMLEIVQCRLNKSDKLGRLNIIEGSHNGKGEVSWGWRKVGCEKRQVKRGAGLTKYIRLRVRVDSGLGYKTKIHSN